MNNFKTVALVSLTTIALGTSFNSTAGMDPYLENALISVCKSAQSDDLLDMRKTIKSYRLKEQTVASHVVCNGEDITSFALSNGATRTAGHLEKRLGDREIVDLAQVYAVNF